MTITERWNMFVHLHIDSGFIMDKKGSEQTTDTVSPGKRSEIMSKVGSKNTKPEMVVRSLLHRLGYRFRLHRNDLPGKPDIVLPKYQSVIFVHGCFWHQHPGCRKATIPQTNTDYWKDKLTRNQERDVEQVISLTALGWKTLVVWECETRELPELGKKLTAFLHR